MIITTESLSPRDRHQLLTSLVVPRPIAWISSRSSDGRRNLAPFSFYMGVSATPFLVAVSIGSRRGAPKDTLVNIRETGVFCINTASASMLAALNDSSGEYGPEVDEFDHAGLEAAAAATVDCPVVVGAPAVLECRLFREVDLEGSSNALVIGEVVAVRLRDDVEPLPGTRSVPPEPLEPVARLGGDLYSLHGEVLRLPRPA
jgi:flavin reductase (DIM6/NTAB) family NADH-FMN oxidoreductase RutF